PVALLMAIRRRRRGRRGRRGEVGGARLANILGLLVEILDADPRQRADREAVPDDLVGMLVVDVDLDGPSVAGNENRLAEHFESGADRVGIEPLTGAGLGEEHRLVAEA